jgi:alpha,alpha-trehalase
MLDYGIVGNCKTSALIKQNGSVDWMCYPTFSSPSVFAKILDTHKGGSFEIKPVGKYKVNQRYIPDTAILETTFTSERNSFQLFDFFPRYKKLLRKGHEKLVRQNVLVRLVKKVKGSPKIRVTYDPEPNYAREECKFTEKENVLICALPESNSFHLTSNIPLEMITKAEVIDLDTSKFFVCGGDVSGYSLKRCNELLTATKKYWHGWCSSLELPVANRDLIVRSAITLKLLTYSPTGAIIAAPTTSIPEEVGSVRTWDYRYCWVRDAAFCVDALKKIGRDYESKKLLSFIIDQVLKNDYIQIMYGINGETRLKEEFLEHLDGFKGSKPVRIGNAAYNQIQHDIYGEILDIMFLYFVFYEFEKKVSMKYWRFIKYVVNQIKFNWDKPDSGIWEIRGTFAHYTYSKFMCYTGVDRAIKIAQHFGKEGVVEDWLKLKEEIKEDIISKGYNKKVKSFTMYYGSPYLDASLLHMGYHEFLERDDPRLINTVKAIDKGLRKGYLVQRYKVDDDFGKSNSAFTICSFWLVEALHYIGEEKKARDLYNKIVKHANHLGLFSEDIDLKSKKLIGNFPQAYTHIALINTSVLLSEWSTKRKKFSTLLARRARWN